VAAKRAAAKAPAAGYSKRSRLDKLGVKEGARLAVIGVDDAFILRELAERTADVTIARAKKDSDMILFGMGDAKPLARLGALVKLIKRDGCIWAIWPKGRKDIKEDMIRAAAIANGLVDVKVMAFSETLSGLKLVIPLSKR
jgi:hypothetical protein